MRVKAQRVRERAALQQQAQRLRDVAPPRGVFCLKSGEPPVVVHSDERGIVIEGEDEPIYDAESGLDPRKSRQLVRTWNSRAAGDERARLRVQATLGSFDGGQLVRWLVARGQLRRSLLLLQQL